MRVLKVFSVIFFAASAISAQVTSRYTDLDAEKCKTLELEEDEGGVYKGECAGVGGYKLHVLEGDLRQTINVIAPGGKEHELRLWEHFTAFTSVGPRAEWRVKAKKPFALIFRFNVSENPEDSSKTTSYLIVAKVSPNLACVTEIIKPSRKQNAEARRAADRSATVPCKIAE